MDHQGEYKLDECSQKEGIKREFTLAYTPQHNGVFERKNKTLLIIILVMLNHAKLLKVFWGEALLITNYVQNRCPKRVINNNETPYELWFGHELNLSNLKVFGCKSHVLIHKKLRHKLDTHLIECIFLGYNDGSKAYLLMKTKNKTIFISQDVIFDEIFTKEIEPILHVEDDEHIILDANLFKNLIMEPTNQGQPIHLPPHGATE